MPPTLPHVTVVVLNWNGWRDTLQCLQSLQKVNYPAFEVLLVDNASTDDSLTRIRSAWPGLEIVQTEKNLGFGGGCNVGMQRALERGTDFVWLINSDATAAPDSLRALVQVALKDARIGAVGSMVFEMDAPQVVQCWGGGNVNCWTGRSRHRRAEGPVDFVSGASMLLRSAALEAVGLFDQNTFFMYWEDTDLSFRLRKAGWRLAVASESHVWHRQSASLGQCNPAREAMFTGSAVRFLRRYATWPVLSVGILLTLLMGKRIFLGQFARARAVFQGYRSA